ncbi:MAG TPA: PAS domain S-box protein [Anaerolineales bacterium]|nr:PAS domain S-box protein [Anaerolineales bacterium]
MKNQLFPEINESEARFWAAFDSSAIGMGLLSLDGKILQVNDAVVKMSGFSRDELIGRFDNQNVLPEDQTLGMDMFQELIDGKRDWFQVEKRYLRKNGDVFWTRLTLSVVRGEAGQPLYLVGLIDDIDEDKKSQQALQESEARFRAMFDNAVVGITLIAPDRRVLAINPAVVKMSGYTEAELLAMTGQDITHPDDMSIGSLEFTEVLAGRRNSFTIEKRYIHKDGVIYWARLSISAVRDADGKLLYLVAITEDIDQQKRTLEDLRESEARFRAMFEHSAIGIGIMGLDRKVTAMNPAICKMFGYEAHELLGRTPVFVTHPDDFQESTRQYQDILNDTTDHFTAERRYLRKNGESFWAQVSMSLVRHADGSPNYLIGLMVDIDAQKKAQDRLAEQEADYLRNLQKRVAERTRELEEANRQLQLEIEQRKRIERELAQKAAEEAVTADRTRLARDLHDAVTQTLFSASLTAEVLPELWEMDAEEAKKSTEELRQLTRGALAEMRTLLLELRPATLTQTRLKDLIRQLCEAFIGRSRLPIELHIEGDYELPPEVQVAFYRIAQESLNNVFKYARAARVDVNLFISPSSVHFETCDNGIGFDMSASKPTSLGMRIMRERAEAIGADFHISSTLGSGTCVEVTWNQDPNLKLRVL